MSCNDEAMIRGSKLSLIHEAKSNAGLDLLKLGKAVCKVYWETSFYKKFGTGFFCELTCSNKRFEGLFTCSHVINCLQPFVIEFELTRFSNTIHPNDVKWFYTNSDLDFTFIVFSDAMNYFIRAKNSLFQLSTVQLTVHSHVTILQHPLGKELSVSDGCVTSIKGCTIFYTSSTLGGSSGAAILNDKSQVVAIHRQGGPITEVPSGEKTAEHNIGTLISEVIQTMSKAKPWDDSIWKPCDDNPNDSLTQITSLPQHASADSLCSMSTKYIDYGNGFMCLVTLRNGVILKGLLTNKHVLLSKADPFVPITLHFGSDKFVLQSTDLAWVHADDKLHFTFMSFNGTFIDEISNEKRIFLSLASEEPQKGSKFFLIQHLNGKEPMVYEGVLDEGTNTSVCHDGIRQPHVHGSVILNENSEVIGIGNTCGSIRQIGTFVTHHKIANILEEIYLNKIHSKCVLIKEVTDKSVEIAAAALCKISTNSENCTGFLCSVSYPNNKKFHGMFTNFHFIKPKQVFNIHFEKVNITLTVESSHIQYFFCDKTLEITFLTFHDKFADELRKKGLVFLSLNAQDPPVFSPIMLLHHPGGKEASLSRGVVINYDDYNLHHISYTSFGSAGAPILNEKHEVIGIHRGTGPFNETGQALYKIGTKMADIERFILRKRLTITV